MEFDANFWIRPNKALRDISFWAFVRANRLREKEKRREEKEKNKKEEKCKKRKCMKIVWNYHNIFLSKLCRKNLTRNVVDWYEIGVMVYFEFWVELVFGLEGIPVKMAQNWPFLLGLIPLRLGVGVHA